MTGDSPDAGLILDPDPVPRFGPAVVIVSATDVVPAPAASVAGANSQVVNAGRPPHAKLMAAARAVPPAGTIENV